MKFLDMEIENFLGISSAKVKLADRGLVVIQGVNSDDSSADSNGAGKSSIADALCWVGYGTTARDATGDEVVNDKAGKNTRVVLRVIDDKTTYSIIRHRKHKEHKNALHLKAYDGMVETDLTKGTEKLTQEEVQRVLGASLEVFRGAIYAGQERMPDLPAMTDKQLKLLIEEAAGVTVLEDAYRLALTDASAAKERVAAAERSRDLLTQQLGWVIDQIRDVNVQIDSFEERRKLSIQTQTEEVQTLVRDIKAVDLSFDLAGAESRVAAIDAAIAATASENHMLAGHRDLISRVETHIRALEGVEIPGNEAALKRAMTEQANVAHKIGCPCEECGRPLTAAELEAARAAADKKVDAYHKALREASVRLADFKANLVRHIADRDAFVATMTDVSAVSAERAGLQHEIGAHNQRLARRNAMLERAKQIKATIDREAAALNPHHAQLTDLSVKEKVLHDKLAEQIKEIDKLSIEADIEAEVVRTFGPAGVRAHILDEVTPYLNGQTSRYLSVLSDGNLNANWTTLTTNAKGELREKFTIEVENALGGKSFRLVSGGQKRKVRIATALALQDLVATRAVKPIELFIADEIDDALDPAGLERLMQILEEKASERGSVLVISHNSLRDWIDQVITVERKGGTTTITEDAA